MTGGDMEHSLLFAKILGPYFAIIGIGIFFNPKHCQKVVLEYSQSAALVYTGGILALLFGLLIIAFHNVWVSNCTTTITFLGWLSLAKGCWLLIFPNTVKNFTKRYQKNTQPIIAQSLIILAVGIFLILKGYCGA